mgnify:CR=1 FL=1
MVEPCNPCHFPVNFAEKVFGVFRILYTVQALFEFSPEITIKLRLWLWCFYLSRVDQWNLGFIWVDIPESIYLIQITWSILLRYITVYIASIFHLIILKFANYCQFIYEEKITRFTSMTCCFRPQLWSKLRKLVSEREESEENKPITNFGK